MKQVAAAFVKAKRAFGPVLKDKTNPAFKSKYADLGACLEAIDEPCLSAGLAVYQETFEDATGVTVETVFLHESGESLRCGKLHVPAAKQDPQGYGSALTYARRYSLMAACGIAPEDDDGAGAAKARQAQRQQWINDTTVRLEGCETADELKAVWSAAVATTKAEGDREAFDILKPVMERVAAGIKKPAQKEIA